MSDEENVIVMDSGTVNAKDLFFKDGKRRIDFVLVYEDEKKGTMNEKRKKQREYFEGSLMKMGLELETAPSVSDGNIIFEKVHVPWDMLCTYAEKLCIKLPFQKNDLSKSLRNCFTKCFFRCPDEAKCFTAAFSKDLMKNSCYFNDQDQFFTPALRSRIAYYILRRAKYKQKYEKKKFDISKLLDEGVYEAAYPLHDCKFNVKSADENCPNERYRLYKEWAKPKNFYKMQPLNLIRKYYGEKIAIYFAWLGFYTRMLAFAAVVGLGCFIYGYRTQPISTWSKEVCDERIGGSIAMCPQCDRECTYWRLSITCESSKRISIFDNYGTMVFAVFMSIWVTLFLEFWKRYQAELQFKWDTVELKQEEPPRPEYKEKCDDKDRIKDPITQEYVKVPYSACGKCIRVSFGIGTVLFWILLIVAAAVGIIMYRLAVFFVFSAKLRQDLKYITPQTATNITASLISLIVIMILNCVYERVAKWITDFEIPRTNTEYENSLTLKIFLFQFVNYYSACFYIAFVKGKVVGYPGQPVYWLGKYRNEECDPGGCLIELTTQLMVIMGGKAILSNIQEVLMPWVKNLRARCRSKSSSDKESIPRWEQDYQLQPVGKLGLFYEYLEMVIQFGFVTLFVAAFPLAPLLALLNNILEIRIDAWKYTTQFRRVIPEKVQDIGAWQPILQGVAILAVVTNVMIIAFTSDVIPRLLYYWSVSVSDGGPIHTMEGYINKSLSIFDIKDFSETSRPRITPYWFQDNTTCRYRDFRHPPGHPKQYEHSGYYWHLIAAKVVFIIIVEHIVYLTELILAYVIPDVPLIVKQQIEREEYLTYKMDEVDEWNEVFEWDVMDEA